MALLPAPNLNPAGSPPRTPRAAVLSPSPTGGKPASDDETEMLNSTMLTHGGPTHPELGHFLGGPWKNQTPDQVREQLLAAHRGGSSDPTMQPPGSMAHSDAQWRSMFPNSPNGQPRGATPPATGLQSGGLTSGGLSTPTPVPAAAPSGTPAPVPSPTATPAPNGVPDSGASTSSAVLPATPSASAAPAPPGATTTQPLGPGAAMTTNGSDPNRIQRSLVSPFGTGSSNTSGEFHGTRTPYLGDETGDHTDEVLAHLRPKMTPPPMSPAARMTPAQIARKLPAGQTGFKKGIGDDDEESGQRYA